MRAITICEPWASLIIAEVKPIENRTWPTTHRGPIAIHAGKSRSHVGRIYAAPADFSARYKVSPPPIETLHFGAVLGTANLVDVVRLADLPEDLRGNPFAEGPWCWILRDVRRFTTPIPMLGQLSIWTIPDGLLTLPLAT